MKNVILAVALVAVGVGCGASDGGTEESASREATATPTKVAPTSPVEAPKAGDTQKPGTTEDFIIGRFCNQASCSAAGGYCSGAWCDEGCENSPLSCTAQAVSGEGWIIVNCSGTGNGYYSVQVTTAPPIDLGIGEEYPNGPWTLWWAPDYTTGSQGYFQFSNAPISLYIDEHNIYYGCNPATGYPGPGCQCNATTGAGCTIVPTFVQVCAQPGAGQYTAQSGVCQGNGENFDDVQCVEVPVTY
jgi:hypothetical protein